MSFFVNKRIYSNYIPEINRFYKNREVTKKNLKRKWFPPAKGVELKQDPKGTEKIHKMNELDKKFCREIFEASKTQDSERALNAYHKLGYNKGDIRVYTALIKSLNIENNLGETFEIYEDILKRNIQPNLVTFETLLDCCITNNHLERGIFVFNELIKRNKKIEKVERFFKKLIFLCFKNKSSSKGSLIFDYLNSKKMINNEFEFLKSSLEMMNYEIKEEEEEEIKIYLNEIKKIKKPNHLNINFEQKNQLLNVEKMFKQNLKDIEPQNENEEMINDFNFDKFPGNHDNFEIQKFYDESWSNLFSSIFDQSIHKIEHSMNQEKKENLFLYEKYSKSILNSLETLDDDQISNIYKEFKNEQLHFNLKKSNLNWTPFIIGFDGNHFYPKDLSINVVNSKKVKHAKQQYLDTIKDEEIKKDIEKNLNQMIKILWKDENGNTLEGLEH
eukprot:gene3437-6086_t